MRHLNCFLTIHLVHLQTFCQIKSIWKNNGGCNFGISYPSMYQNVTDGKFLFYDAIYSKTTTAYYWEPGLYSSVPDIVEAMNLLIQERNNHNENCITVEVSRRTQKIELSLISDDFSLVIFSTDLGSIFGGDVGDDKGILMRGKGPHEPKFAYDFFRIHPLKIYTDIVEYNIVGDTKAPLLRCFLFIFKLKSGDVITTGQYMNHQTFINIQFRRLLEKSFHSKLVNLRDTSGEKILFVSVGITRLVLMF